MNNARPKKQSKNKPLFTAQMGIITLSHLSSGIMSKQNRLSIDSDILINKSHLFFLKKDVTTATSFVLPVYAGLHPESFV